MNFLNIEMRLNGFNEKTSLIKNHILILCIHQCLDKKKQAFKHRFLFHSLVFARQAFGFHRMPGKFIWKQIVSAYVIFEQY